MQQSTNSQANTNMGDRITLKRHIYTHAKLEAEYRKGKPPRLTVADKVKAKCKCSSKAVWYFITSFLPILKVIAEYDFKRFFLGDFLSGLNVSFMHLPQGMGFGLLAGLQPVYGLYTTFFPVVFYLVFGTSPHISFGTNAVLALFTQSVVEREAAMYRSNIQTTTSAYVSSDLTTSSNWNINATIDIQTNFNDSNFGNSTMELTSILNTTQIYLFINSSGTNPSIENATSYSGTRSFIQNLTASKPTQNVTADSDTSDTITQTNFVSHTIENATKYFENHTNTLTDNASIVSDYSHKLSNLTQNVTDNSSFTSNSTDSVILYNLTDLYENTSWITEAVTTALGQNSDEEIMRVKVGAAMTASLIVGTILGGMGLLRLGFLTNYFSMSFIGGFTTAAAIHIVSSQIPKALGVTVGLHSGVGRLVKMYIDLFTNITDTKVPEVIITVVCIIILLTVKIINDRFKKQMKFPIPIDLLVVIIGTIASHFGKFEEQYNVVVVGDIPSGIPAPKVPNIDSVYRMATDCVVMAVLSFAMSISMAKLKANVHGIKIDGSQELLAYGISNVGSSFFSCFPQATAPPRTMLLESMGSKTTLNAVPTAIFMVLVLFWIGSLFISLPISVLSAMIIVSMKDLLLQFRDIPRYWKINKYDCLTWIITCSVSVFVDLDYGIISGIGVSMFFVIVQHQLASGRLLGQSETEDIIMDIKYRNRLLEYPGIKIFQFEAPLCFANVEKFKTELNNLVANPMKVKKAQRLFGPVIQIDVPGSDDKPSERNGKNKHVRRESDRTFSHRRNYLRKVSKDVPHHLVIDCQMLSYIDYAGVNMMHLIVKEYRDIDVTVFLAKCPKRMLNVLESAAFFDKFPREHVFFDVVDAVETAAQSDIAHERNARCQSISEYEPHYSEIDHVKEYVKPPDVAHGNKKNRPILDEEITKL